MMAQCVWEPRDSADLCGFVLSSTVHWQCPQRPICFDWSAVCRPLYILHLQLSTRIHSAWSWDTLFFWMNDPHHDSMIFSIASKANHPWFHACELLQFSMIGPTTYLLCAYMKPLRTGWNGSLISKHKDISICWTTKNLKVKTRPRVTSPIWPWNDVQASMRDPRWDSAPGAVRVVFDLSRGRYLVTLFSAYLYIYIRYKIYDIWYMIYNKNNSNK